MIVRHTLTLDADVDARIAEACKASGKPFKQVVNSLLRQGLSLSETAASMPPLKIRTTEMGLQPGISLVSISELESLIEEQSFR
jgi:hypothetical protein